MPAPLRFGRVYGAGAHSVVRQVLDPVTGRPTGTVAKTLRSTHAFDEDGITPNALREIALLLRAADAGRQNMVRLLHVVSELDADGDGPHLVLEELDGDIWHVLSDVRHRRPRDRLARRAFDALGGVVAALRFVHANGYAHGDVRMANVLVANAWEVRANKKACVKLKLADLSLAISTRFAARQVAGVAMEGASPEAARNTAYPLGAAAEAPAGRPADGDVVDFPASVCALDVWAMGVLSFNVLNDTPALGGHTLFCPPDVAAEKLARTVADQHALWEQRVRKNVRPVAWTKPAAGENKRDDGERGKRLFDVGACCDDYVRVAHDNDDDDVRICYDGEQVALRRALRLPRDAVVCPFLTDVLEANPEKRPSMALLQKLFDAHVSAGGAGETRLYKEEWFLS